MVKYTVTGCDEEGSFEVRRRYKEFYQLWASLIERWPGCYVPGIPPKKMLDNKNEGFIEKRRWLLERFMREISKQKHLINSYEFKLFTRHD